jgi:hypothetical protein
VLTKIRSGWVHQRLVGCSMKPRRNSVARFRATRGPLTTISAVGLIVLTVGLFGAEPVGAVAPPVLGALSVVRLSGPSGTTTPLNGPACPSQHGQSVTAGAVSLQAHYHSGIIGTIRPGKPSNTTTLFTSGPVGTETIRVECIANRKVIATYPPITFRITQKQPTVVVTPTKVHRGGTVTLSPGIGCGAYPKPGRLAFVLTYFANTTFSVNGFPENVGASGHWKPVRVKIPANTATGMWFASVNCNGADHAIHSHVAAQRRRPATVPSAFDGAGHDGHRTGCGFRTPVGNVSSIALII